MSDKLPQGISVLTTFNSGEQPTAAKLNSITAQLRYAASELERAVGDIHGQSWPYSAASDTSLSLPWGASRVSANFLSSTQDRFLDIANIGRLIGAASNLNPRMIGSQPITETVPVGVHAFELRYVPENIATITFSDGTVFANRVLAAGSLINAGDYAVTNNGKVYTVTATNGGTMTYTTVPTEYAGGQAPSGSRFNVIPDPNQISAGGSGLAFSAPDSQGRRTATLPLCTHQQSNYDGSSIQLDTDDALYNYQLELPLILTRNYVNGDEIPPGFLFLRNQTTGEVYEDADYFYGSSTSFIVGNVDLTTEIDRGDDFVCITVGSDITTAIDDLRVKSFHSHNRDFGEPFVPVNGIAGWTEEAGNSGAFVPSEIPGNFAPQYLHRDGWDNTGATDGNINDENAMRGHLLFGLTGGSAGSYLGADGETFKVYFGNSIGGSTCNIGKDSSSELVIRNGGLDNRGITLKGTGAGGGVVTMESGFKGIYGSQTNAIQCVAISGTIGDKSVPIQLVDLVSALGFSGTEEIYGLNVVVEMNGLGTDDWFPPGHPTSTLNYGVVADSFRTVDYLPNGSVPSGAAGWRVVVWYRL